MQILTKQEALEFLPAHISGQYNPAKYVMGGFVGSRRKILLHLYREAVKVNTTTRAAVEAERLAMKIQPLNRAMKSGNRPKLFWSAPRDIDVRIPALRQYGDVWLIFTNCKLNGGFYKNVPGVVARPEMTSFASELRQTQRRVLP